MPWKIVHTFPDGATYSEFEGEPTIEEEMVFYKKAAGVKAAVRHQTPRPDPKATKPPKPQ
jgi:hypothetical protein